MFEGDFCVIVDEGVWTMLHNFSREPEFPERLETKYFRILSYEFPPGYAGVYRSREYTRFCTILDGEKTVSLNHGRRYRYDSSKFLLMPRESHVDMTITRPTKAVVFELNNDLTENVSRHVSLDLQTDYHGLVEDKFLLSRLTPQLRDILGRIRETVVLQQKDSKYILDLYAQELAYYLIKIKGAGQVLDLEPDHPVSQAVRYMQKEYAGRVSIKQLAADLGMSESNFSQQFKKIVGIGPKEYLTRIKMEKAEEIIAHESVTDTAFDLGYENISNFIENFKAVHGVTPKQYKKRLEV